jgi:tetratricopeptide (TPR) repeat protein
MTALLLAAILLGPDEGDVDRIMLRFAQRREGVQSQAEFSRILAETRSELERYLKDHGNSPRALFHVAETYLWEGNYAAGLEKLGALTATCPDTSDGATAQLLIGQILARNGDGEGARKAFDRFIERYPNDERVLLAKSLSAVTLQNEERYDEAAELLRQVRETYRDRKESWAAELQRSVIFHLQGKNEDAEKVLEGVIRDCPDPSQKEVARTLRSRYQKVGEEAPSFVDRDLQGNVLSLKAFRNRITILYFFDSSAPAALTEVQFLQRIRKAFAPNQVAILGVSVNLNREDLLNFRDLQKISWPLLFDGLGLGGPLARTYDVRGLPSLAVIDQQGKFRFFNVAGRDLENVLRRLVAEE